MIVIKLGGSLYNNPELNHWLTAISHYTNDSIIIVPGGGPFADLVRSSQKQHQFDDPTAHHMAVLAMAQFGLVIKSKLKNCHIAYTVDQFNHDSGLTIWLPSKEVLNKPELAQNWDITSDSLALWLAQQLNATQLILVKSVQCLTQDTLNSLSQRDVIDNGFQAIFHKKPVNTYVMHDAQYQDLTRLPSLTPLAAS